MAKKGFSYRLDPALMALFEDEVAAFKSEINAVELTKTDVIEALITAWLDDRARQKRDGSPAA